MRSVGPYFLTKCVKKYKIMTQKELKKSSHKDLIHDAVSQHKSQYSMTRSSSRLSLSNLSQSLSKSELKEKFILQMWSIYIQQVHWIYV